MKILFTESNKERTFIGFMIHIYNILRLGHSIFSQCLV